MLEKFKSTHNKADSRADSGQSSDSAITGQDEITCIGEAISIEGSISGKGNLEIQGNIKGNIDLTGYQLTVGPKGCVEADVHAEKVTISGKMKGNVTAQGKVEITKSADFEGEIRAKRISVEDGAYIKAVIELEKKQAEKGEAKNKSTPYTAAGIRQHPVRAAEKKGTGG